MNILFIVIGILLFNFIVLAHEWGHYFTAKSFGVKVNEFALGMGPIVFKVKKGETIFSLRALPIGGFCAMEGEDEKSNDPGAFDTKKPWQKMIAIMNLVVGFLITFILAQTNYTPLASTSIAKFTENASSESSGLAVGDEIIKINSSSIVSYKDLSFQILSSKNPTFEVTVKRNGEKITLKDVTFGTKDAEGSSNKQIDFYVASLNKNFGNLLKFSFLDTVSTVKVVWSGVIGLITRSISLKEMTGPVGIASAMNEVAKEGLKISWWFAFGNLLNLIALITINLGVVNLLPLPALDGGRLVFILFELITGKKVSAKYEGWVHTIGFILFILLIIFIFYNDIMRLLGKS